MRFRSCSALLLLLMACATTPSPRESVPLSRRIANLQRAAQYPWTDDGHCVVREASQPWDVAMERCFHVLDTRKIQFNDPERHCTVASAGAAAVPAVVALCLLSQPVVVGAVIVIGAVVVAVAIKEELDAYERRKRTAPVAEGSSGAGRPAHVTRPSREGELSANPRPGPGSSGATQDPLPPLPTQPRRPECEPTPVPHLGGDALHNQCADDVPLNDFRGYDALVNGKRFDALELRRRMLWEIKTDNFDSYPPELRNIVIGKQVRELQRERGLAAACGFDFQVGVRSVAHKAALELADGSLQIVVMDWC